MRIVVLANKWWECEAMLAAMLNSNAFPPPLVKKDNTKIVVSPWYDTLFSPRAQGTDDAYKATSRATFSYRDDTGNQVFSVEVWCVSDLLEKTDPSGSSSSAKSAHVAVKLFAAPLPDLTIAVGTGGTAREFPNRSGGVAIGGQVFLHNAHIPGTPNANPQSTWSNARQEALIAPSISESFFGQIAAFDSATALLHFLPLRRGGSSSPIITIGLTDVALGTLNVTDYNEYKLKDRETVRAFDRQAYTDEPVSLETTHGLIRLASDPAPFIFVTGITDNFLHFDDQVGGLATADPQNFAAAYNAGISVRHMLASLMRNKMNL